VEQILQVCRKRPKLLWLVSLSIAEALAKLRAPNGRGVALGVRAVVDGFEIGTLLKAIRRRRQREPRKT
jgi:hypothetical protein